MSDSLFSTYWYRVAKLKPTLRDCAQVSRHSYRGQTWYVIRNVLTARNHRFNAAAYRLIGLMDGQRSVQELWEYGSEASDQPPAQDEVIRLLAQLYQADLIQSDIQPSIVELFNQVREQQGQKLKKQVANPFSLKFPLWDPERFLHRWQFLVAPLFSRAGLIFWLLIVATALVLTLQNLPDLSGRLQDQLFSPQNLLLLWLVYPLVKIVHELGHAFAIKKWGGEVHEMGIILLALTPIPYVEASSSAAFIDKRQRMAVSAMGMIVELLLASLALFVWLNVESGIVSSIAYNVMLIGGVSTLLFNGNPLLRYDGYYILADLIEIPNLAQRSTSYLGYLLQKRLLGVEGLSSPVSAPGEKGWFLAYGPVSFIYRITIVVALILLVSERFFIVGVLIAVWGVIGLLLLPTLRNFKKLLDSTTAQQKRRRLSAIAAAAVALLILGLFVIPFPHWTTTQGVIWLPEQAAVRAGADCEVKQVLASAEEPVAAGSPLIAGDDPFLQAEIDVLKAQLQELYASFNALPLSERVQRKILQDEIALLKQELSQVEAEQEKLLVRSPSQGRFVLIDAQELPGRFVRQGELLGYIVANHRPTVRAVVRQDDFSLIQDRTRAVQIRLAEQGDKTLSASIERLIPAADINLPSAALGTAGGGDILVDPSDAEGLRALENLFQLDISLPEQISNPHIGGRVFVKFKHQAMPLAQQWYRHLRQLFLRKYYV